MRKLGNSGLEVGPLALGGNVFGWTADEPTSFRLLDAFVAAGFNLIDTADMYSRWVPGHPGGESETVIGNWFKRSGKRGNVVLATKVGNEMGPGEQGPLESLTFCERWNDRSGAFRQTTSTSTSRTWTTRQLRSKRPWRPMAS